MTLVSNIKTIDPQFFTVFKPYDGKYPCYRQVSNIYDTLNLPRKKRIL